MLSKSVFVRKIFCSAVRSASPHEISTRKQTRLPTLAIGHKLVPKFAKLSSRKLNTLNLPSLPVFFKGGVIVSPEQR